VQFFCRAVLVIILWAVSAGGHAAKQDDPVDNQPASEEKKSFFAKFKDPEDGMFDASGWLLENIVGFMPVPLIITEPAVDNGLGFAGMFFHKPTEGQMDPADKNNLVLPNISVIAAAYTGNGSWLIGGGHFHNWKDDHYRYNVTGGYADMNLDWFGNGNFPVPDDGVRFNVTGGMISNEFLIRIGNSRWFMGADWRYSVSAATFETDLPFDPPTFDNTLSGLGVVALYENLDFRLSPRKGFKSELQVTVNSDKIGSDFNYDEFSWKIRQYFEFGEKYSFSWRLDGATTSGDVPFYLEPFIQIEGIPALRYQGPTAATLEVRGGIDFHRRWTALAFVGGGRTGDSISDLSSATTRSAYGVGVRYLMAKVLGLRIGIDIARGPEGTYGYLIIGSAWNTSGF
jgi:hypothetical protein